MLLFLTQLILWLNQTKSKKYEFSFSLQKKEANISLVIQAVAIRFSEIAYSL